MLGLISTGEGVRVAAARGGDLGGSRLCAHDPSLHVLEHTLDTSDVSFKGLIQPHFFSQLILCQSSLHRPLIIELLLPDRVFDESQVPLIFGKSFKLVEELFGLLGAFLECLVPNEISGARRDVVADALKSEVNEEADADDEDDCQVYYWRRKQELEGEVVLEGDPGVGDDQVGEVVANGGEKQMAGRYVPVDLLVLQEDLEGDDEHHAREHRDAHCPVVARLAIRVQRLLEDFSYDEVRDHAFVEASDQPPEQRVLVE